MKKKVFFGFFVILFLFTVFCSLFFAFVEVPFFSVVFTGHAVNDTGVVQIYIDKTLPIYIESPENITYNFSKGELYIVELNVSAGFTADEWKYSLYDLTHEVFVEEDVVFVPNSSISAVRWGNLLTVFAHEEDGEWGSENVTFYVNVPNSAPLFGNITSPIFVCERETLAYEINATDIDEENLTGDISPKNPFYLSFQNRSVNVSYFDIISGVLGKEDVGNYSETLSVVDPWDAVDTKNISIEVIEINNNPVFEGIGAQTVWLKGENSTFYHVFNVSDVEDGVTSDGNFTFNLTWGASENLFDVGVNDGVINYTPVLGHEGSVYSLTICVEDNALASVHDNISLCLPNDDESNVVCDNFTLTVTDENRAPEIVNYTPLSGILNVDGLHNVEYWVEVYDKDGTIPDIDWFVDGVRLEHNENISNDTFVYAFACAVSGVHSVEVVTTDGLLNDSQTWYISVNEALCPVERSGGGGGSSHTDYCAENWFCDDWHVCQNVKRSFDSGILSIEDYSVAKEACFQNKEEDERFCGFQITNCYDLNACSNSKMIFPKPLEKRFCYFTENPSCFDEITNCHDGGCELLADCGGPCEPCATCSDGKQNQGEGGVDCGGPCPYFCEPEVPFAMISSVLMVMAIALIILILWVLWRLFLLWKRRDKGDD